MMVCVSVDGHRSVGTAAKDYCLLFHNQANGNLLCIHSALELVQVLGPREAASFAPEGVFRRGGYDGLRGGARGRPSLITRLMVPNPRCGSDLAPDEANRGVLRVELAGSGAPVPVGTGRFLLGRCTKGALMMHNVGAMNS